MTNQVDFSRTNKFLSAIEQIQLLGFEKSMRAYLVQGLFKDQLSNHLFHECAPPPQNTCPYPDVTVCQRYRLLKMSRSTAQVTTPGGVRVGVGGKGELP